MSTSPLNDYLAGEGNYEALTSLRNAAVATCSWFALGASCAPTDEALHKRMRETPELVDHVMEQAGLEGKVTEVLLLMWVIEQVTRFRGSPTIARGCWSVP